LKQTAINENVTYIWFENW